MGGSVVGRTDLGKCYPELNGAKMTYGDLAQIYEAMAQIRVLEVARHHAGHTPSDSVGHLEPHMHC